MNLKNISALIFALGLFVLVPLEALACACCAEPGTYSISTQKPGNLEYDELKKIRFGTADLFTTAAGREIIQGIAPIGESYSADALLQGGVWKFTLRDEKNNAGTLNLLKPVSMVAFMADIHDGKQSAGGGPLLYKEWRFKYRTAGGTGIFQKGIAPATEYFLVLQGRGNACPQAEDFTNWRLEISGKKANYAFFGALSSGKETN